MNRLRQAASLVAGLLFVAVFAVFDWKIALRYFAGDAATWADEVSVVLFIAIVFWANAFVVRDRDQITFDLLYNPAPPALRRAMAIARCLLVGGVFACALPGTVDYLQFLWRERTPVLGLRLDWVYAPFGLFMAAVVVRAVWGLARLLGPRWRDAV